MARKLRIIDFTIRCGTIPAGKIDLNSLLRLGYFCIDTHWTTNCLLSLFYEILFVHVSVSYIFTGLSLIFIVT